jgi:MFS family permease
MTGPIPRPPLTLDTGGRGAGIWTPRYVWVTIGAVALIFLAAMQSLAITTVMPVVSDDLDGAGLYAVAFAGTLATSVIGMVAAGAWSDRGGVLAPLTGATVLFVVGLVVAGLAPTMELLVLGRLIQGLGTGGQVVALYVVVARVYPSTMHGRVFAAFSAAWVVPSLIGPFLAGAVTEYLHWRWVFIGVAILTVVAFTMVVIRLHGLPLHTDEPASGRIAPRLLCAIAVAAGALALSLAGELGVWSPAVVAASVIVIGFAARPLLPARTLLSGRGLPSVVLMRGLIAGALFGAEIYVPYLLIAEYGFSPTWAGLGLTAAALAWAVAAEVQGRIGDRIGNARITLIGIALLFTAVAIAGITALGDLHPTVVIVGWTLAGGGMGLMYPRLTVLTLAYSTPQNQGFNSSALSISDAVGSASTIAAMGLVFTALAGSNAAFPAVFAVAGVLALLALVPGLRLGHAHEADAAKTPPPIA